MATPTTNPKLELGAQERAPSWPVALSASAPANGESYGIDARLSAFDEAQRLRPSGSDALQALLAVAALHQQVRQRRALASRHNGFDVIAQSGEFEPAEHFVLDEVLQSVAERAISITGADGLGIALAENNEIVLRASAGAIKPDVGARIQRDSAFSGACFRTARIIRCDDTETDDRVNLDACRKLGARSMVAVPLCGRKRVIGLLEAFSAEPFGFNDSDVSSLELLAELILGALKPEDEDRFAESAQMAEAGLAASALLPAATLPVEKILDSETHTETVVTAPLSEDAASSTSVSASPASTIEIPELELASQAVNEPEPFAENAIPEESALQPEPATTRHPGIVFVLVLLVVFVLVAGGLWWKLKNVQLDNTLVQPANKATTNPSAAPKQPVTPSPNSSSATSSNPVPQAQPQANSTALSPSSALNTPSVLATASVAPQEVSKLTRISGIRHWSSADSSTVVLDLQDQVQYEAHRLTAPDRIYFDLHDTSVAPEIEGKTIEVGDPLLARVRVAQPVPGLTRVVLETKGNSNYSVSLEPNPYRLVVQVRKLGADPKAQINLFPGAAEAERRKLAIVVPPPTKEDLQLRAHVPKMRIVVDAGHGGWDLGTVGRRGLLEKDLVLEIAQRLGKLLESRLGADVILTRNDDNYIPLDERAGVANQSQADLFVSVHANYSDLPSARGVETYYTNFFSSPNAKDLETRQNAASTRNAVTAAVL